MMKEKWRSKAVICCGAIGVRWVGQMPKKNAALLNLLYPAQEQKEVR